MDTEHDAGGTGTALVPAGGEEKPPEFTREELALVDGGDAQQQKTVPATRSAAEARLAEIRALRKTDEKRYWSDAVQKEERDLIRAMSAPADATGQATGDGADLAAVQKRLSEIKTLSKSDAKRYWSDAVQKEELALHRQLIELKQEAQQTEQMKGLVDSVLSAVPDATTFEASFNQTFAALAEESQSVVRQALTTPVEPIRAASEEQLTRFRGLGDDAAGLLKSWRSRAGYRLAQAYATLDDMADNLSEEDAGAVERWLGSLSVPERVAVIRALGSM